MNPHIYEWIRVFYCFTARAVNVARRRQSWPCDYVNFNFLY